MKKENGEIIITGAYYEVNKACAVRVLSVNDIDKVITARTARGTILELVNPDHFVSLDPVIMDDKLYKMLNAI